MLLRIRSAHTHVMRVSSPLLLPLLSAVRGIRALHPAGHPLSPLRSTVVSQQPLLLRRREAVRGGAGLWTWGSVLSASASPPDQPEPDHCGTCRRCLDVCPTDAFPAPYRLDARRCIAYLTIEHQGHIPHEFRKAIGNRVFGCDDCLAVCPWNKFAQAARDTQMQARSELAAPALADLAALDDAAFRKLFAGSPVKRLGRNRLVRNVLIAMGNSGNASFCSHIRPHLADASPLVRAMAVWALAQLLDRPAFSTLAAWHLESEPDPQVQREWALAPKGGIGEDCHQPVIR